MGLVLDPLGWLLAAVAVSLAILARPAELLEIGLS
jgi:hypothetical protein